ncbi:MULTISPECIES: chaplin [Streptomyces]|uniref:Chaplin n=2 Tax=Streptomyces TaxID=1883 RepID=A0ABV9IQU0_9ACTN
MRRATRNGVIAVAAASGAMAVATMPAFADSTAAGTAAGSPGLLSGNGIQLPVHLPVNLCGDTVNVVGALNPAFGNGCANRGGGSQAASATGASAQGDTAHSPGVVSGNGVKLPVDLPVNVSGNSVNVVGVANPAFGNESANTPGEEQPPPVAPKPPAKQTPVPEPEAQRPGPGPKTTLPAVAPQAPAPHAGSSLAHTGSDATLPTLAGSMALVLGGALLYRRCRPRPEN